MEINLLEGPMGIDSALLGLGLNFFITSEAKTWNDVPTAEKNRIKGVAAKLACRCGGEDKWLRAVYYSWSIRAPRFFFQELDTYKIGTVAQSESSMRIASLGRSFHPSDFEDGVFPSELNELLAEYKETKNTATLITLKMRLPESFLQRRIWSCSLAVMKNIYFQRKNHRLPHWKCLLNMFVDKTPIWLKGVYDVD